MIKKLGNYFLTGIILTLPLVVTGFVFMFLIRNIGTPVTKVVFVPLFENLDSAYLDKTVVKVVADVISTLLIITLVTILGFTSTFLLGRWLIMISEFTINKIPGVGLIYRTVKQIVDTFSKQNKAVFQSVVLLEFPREGLYAVGFVTNKAKGEVQNKTDDVLTNVFVPTTPNPTSGFLVMVPEHKLQYLEMSVGDAMKLIISGGAVVPPYPNITDNKEITK